MFFGDTVYSCAVLTRDKSALLHRLKLEACCGF